MVTLLVTVFSFSAAHSAPPQSAAQLQYQLTNCYNEIDTLKSRMESLNGMIEDISRNSANAATKGASALEGRMAKLEKVTDGLTTDMRKLHGSITEAMTVLEQHRQALKQVDETTSSHDKSLSKLETALRSMMELTGKSVGAITEPSKAASIIGKSYTVQKGDSLGGIASKAGCSVKSLREANNLEGDKIRQGQLLKLP